MSQKLGKFELRKKGAMQWNSWGFFDTLDEILEELKGTIGEEFNECDTENMYDYLDDYELDIRSL